MIPLRDANPTRTTPYLVYGLVAINAAIFLFQVALGEANQAFVIRHGVVPYLLTSFDTTPSTLLSPLTSMFMHGGWMHVIGNMWFLWVFGDNVEDALGKARFVVFYLACGLAAVAAQVVVDPDSTVPMIGASGAISGVLAGYVLLYPRARVLTLVPIFIFLQFVELPAFLFIFVWFGLQLLSGLVSLGDLGGGGVAWFAHIGGFLAGLALIPILRPPGPRRPEGRVPPRPRFDQPSRRLYH